MRLIPAGALAQTIAIHLYDAEGEPVVVTHEAESLAISVVISTDGRVTATIPLAPVARTAPGVWTSEAITHVSGARHELDLPDATLAASGTVVSAQVTAAGVDASFAESIGLWDPTAAPGGGGPQIVLVPLQATARRLLSPTPLEARIHEARRHRLPIFADGTPLDLSTKTLQFVLRLPEGDVAVEVAAEGDDHNVAVWLATAEMHAAAGRFPWAIRDLQPADGEAALVWAEGSYQVVDVPGPLA